MQLVEHKSKSTSHLVSYATHKGKESNESDSNDKVLINITNIVKAGLLSVYVYKTCCFDFVN
jgi:hypothetical protein